MGSRASSTSSMGQRGDAYLLSDAALIGASRAFHRPPAPRPASITRAPSTTSNSTDGGGAALAAAASSVNKTPSPQSHSRNPHGVSRLIPMASPSGSMASNTPASSAQNVLVLGLSARKSASHQAAQVAAARSPDTSSGNNAPATPRPRAQTVQRPPVSPKSRKLSYHTAPKERRSDGHVQDKPTDTSPIAPTTSLVDLFERKSSGSHAPRNRPEPIVVQSSHDLPIRSPKPVRSSDGGITTLFKMALEDNKETPTPHKPAKSVDATDFALRPHFDGQSQSSNDSNHAPAPEDHSGPTSPITIQKRPSRAAMATVSPTSIAERVRPQPSRLRPSVTGPAGPVKSPSSSRPVTTSPDRRLSVSAQSGKSIPAQYHQMYSHRMTPLHTGDDLANAIVASSLASSRGPCPRKVEPPPPPSTRRHKHHKLGFSRTPSPTKQTGMRQTLRKVETSESEEDDDHDRYKKKRLVRKHPNKHHEGDRKRWRDTITERERKRYEGVFASNKGLHVTFTVEEEYEFHLLASSEATLARKVEIHDCISNIVVRDIWSRSRLPDSTLEAVWDLAVGDGPQVGRLDKIQFVVGLWLIDQRLKGRKLPVKVTDSVRGSVLKVQGIKVKK